MPRRTLENCRLIKKLGRPAISDGKCDGMAKSRTDDEPCETCKKCRLNTWNEEDEQK